MVKGMGLVRLGDGCGRVWGMGWGNWGRVVGGRGCRANKARRLIFMIRHAFIDLSKNASIPLCGVLVCPHLEYGMPNAEAGVNRSERIQRLATRLVTGIRHLPYETRIQWLSLIS